MTCQKLSKQNKAERQSFASWFLKKSAENQNFIHSIWFSDEAHFHLDGTVNSQNNRIWSDNKPETAQEKPLHSSKVTAWCALSSQGVIGPLWFQDSNKKTATVNQERYQAVLEQFWRRANNKHGEDMKHMWFQQDGAPPHTARKTKQWLGEHFGDRVISRGAGDAWPANSPGLTPLDFFLWGHLKGQVYKEDPKTLDELKLAVARAARAIPTDMCRRAVELCKTRAKMCSSRGGGHFESGL